MKTPQNVPLSWFDFTVFFYFYAAALSTHARALHVRMRQRWHKNKLVEKRGPLSHFVRVDPYIIQFAIFCRSFTRNSRNSARSTNSVCTRFNYCALLIITSTRHLYIRMWARMCVPVSLTLDFFVLVFSWQTGKSTAAQRETVNGKATRLEIRSVLSRALTHRGINWTHGWFIMISR